MERQLSILGAFDTPGLEVTGFCSETLLQRVTERIAMSLQASGVKLIGNAATEDDKIRHIDKPAPSQPSIKALKPVSAALQWKTLAQRGTTLICAVPAGGISTQTLEEFQRQAIHSGVNTLAFVLLEE